MRSRTGYQPKDMSGCTAAPKLAPAVDLWTMRLRRTVARAVENAARFPHRAPLRPQPPQRNKLFFTKHGNQDTRTWFNHPSDRTMEQSKTTICAMRFNKLQGSKFVEVPTNY
jgi:hypothetical protein